jgi:hypothetical protein
MAFVLNNLSIYYISLFLMHLLYLLVNIELNIFLVYTDRIIMQKNKIKVKKYDNMLFLWIKLLTDLNSSINPS